MGCDIHFFVEHCHNNRWEVVPPPSHLSNCEMEWDIGRDDELFALLGNNVKVKDLPLIRKKVKPLPKDLTDIVLGKLQFDNSDDYSDYHSHNWLSLEELLAFNWLTPFFVAFMLLIISC